MKMKRWLSCTLALAMLLGLMGCGGTSDEAPNDGSGSSEDEIVINYPTFQIGTNTAAPVVEELVSRFNEEYAGQYRIEVEEIPGDANYADENAVCTVSDRAFLFFAPIYKAVSTLIPPESPIRKPVYMEISVVVDPTAPREIAPAN